MRRTFTLLSSLALLVALPALADAKPKAARWQPTKADFVAYYRPVKVDGLPFYERLGAARWRGERLAAEDGRARLVLQMRVLGRLDGAT